MVDARRRRGDDVTMTAPSRSGRSPFSISLSYARLPSAWMATSPLGEGLVHGEQRRQLLVLDIDERRGGLRGRPARRHDRGDPVADEAHVLAEQRLVVERQVLAGMDTRAAERLHGRVHVREDLDDARHRLGAGRVDPLDDAVRDGAEDELGVEHARHAEVAAVDELPRHLLGHVVDGVAAPDVLQVLGQAPMVSSPLVVLVLSQIRLPGGLSSGRLSSNQRRYCCPAGLRRRGGATPALARAQQLGRQGPADAVGHVDRLVQRQYGLVAGKREVGEHVRHAGGRHDAAAARLAEPAGHRVARQAHEGLQSKRGRASTASGVPADHLRDRGRGHRAADA